MMIGTREAASRMNSSVSSRKENIPMSPTGINRTVAFSTLHPVNQPSRFLPSQKVVITNKPSPIKLGSPR